IAQQRRHRPARIHEGGIRQAQNDHGSLGYTGPCIPRGQVKYKLRLFALDTTITAAGNTKFVDLIPLMNGHIVDAAEYDFIHYLKM
ncbi:MAG: hypothetical protein KKA05_04310, partial [Alphaproteobacteria bacterium]|nr:hypothetical protein [Alphaproteobacteria bacterium]